MADYRWIVTDASPLITLSKANELDVLLKPGWPVYIPDAVLREAGSPQYADGVRIREWVRENDDKVHVVPTEAGALQEALLRATGRAPDMGERASVEVCNYMADRHPDERVMLLYEDADLNKYLIRQRVDLVTTGTLLRELEDARLIQSSDQIIDQAIAANRNAEKQRDQPKNSAFEEALRRSRENDNERER